ncbi:Probable endonuclease [Sparassis crispa]|uniref:Probable endonuclease n=1 Tax=Sparassis crispa TaxID=139825 RepID=A0A401GXQ1_9APHY|nr:Probable endonuclease [Sparassis crispa]GBE87005.1 Probable endonuclease [Sparassis crispa]
MLAKKRWIKGYVTSVGDADNFRVYHTPAFGWRWPLKFRRIPTASRELKDRTIHIRLAGVDAPEAGHFGRPAQAYAQESLAWLKNQTEGKMVYCQLLRRDQYGRIVAHPHLKPWLLPAFLSRGKCVPLEMLRAGWVGVYEQAGAEYGHGGKEAYMRIQSEAQAARRGMWKHGTDGETPAEYKRRYSSGDAKDTPTSKETPTTSRTKSSREGWFRLLLKRAWKK